MAFDCILFDLDGTLLNTNYLVLQSFKHTFKNHLGRQVSDEELRPYFGVPLIDIMKDFDPTQAEEMIITYRDFNRKKHDNLTTLFPGVKETLEELIDKGVKIGVVTSKIRYMAHRGLDLFSLTDYFDAIISFEDTEYHKPHPAPIEKAIEVIYSGLPSVPRSRILMVGDSPFDIKCAANAGVKSAAVEWSMHDIQELKCLQPDLVLSTFSDLCAEV